MANFNERKDERNSDTKNFTNDEVIAFLNQKINIFNPRFKALAISAFSEMVLANLDYIYFMMQARGPSIEFTFSSDDSAKMKEIENLIMKWDRFEKNSFLIIIDNKDGSKSIVFENGFNSAESFKEDNNNIREHEIEAIIPF